MRKPLISKLEAFTKKTVYRKPAVYLRHGKHIGNEQNKGKPSQAGASLPDASNVTMRTLAKSTPHLASPTGAG